MKIGFLGDIILGAKVRISDGIIEVLNTTDFNIGNFEAPFIDDTLRGQTRAGLYQKADDASFLKALNIQVVSLANNHMGDFGPVGIDLTRARLKDQGIAFFGAGKDLEEASEPAVLDVKGKKVACWGYMLRYFSNRYFALASRPGIPKLTEQKILQDIEKTKADIKLLYAHWNQEFEDYPEPVCKELGEKLRGRINLLAGSHPHCLQGIQSFSNYAVLHSLGNFIMPNDSYHHNYLAPYPEKCYRSMFVIADFHADQTLSTTIYPVSISENGMEVDFPDEKERERLLNHISGLSGPLSLDQRSYKKFYARNKTRKMRFTLGKNEGMNYVKMFVYRILFFTSVYLERGIVFLLKKAGIYETIRKRFAGIISKYQDVR
jgi:poly-gamma-glutamate capsule biosynthesis protein CapA/YwtB (metallophosphatase superfamily)